MHFSSPGLATCATTNNPLPCAFSGAGDDGSLYPRAFFLCHNLHAQHRIKTMGAILLRAVKRYSHFARGATGTRPPINEACHIAQRSQPTVLSQRTFFPCDIPRTALRLSADTPPAGQNHRLQSFARPWVCGHQNAPANASSTSVGPALLARITHILTFSPNRALGWSPSAAGSSQWDDQRLLVLND